jgi:hypothetical protein
LAAALHRPLTSIECTAIESPMLLFPIDSLFCQLEFCVALRATAIDFAASKYGFNANGSLEMEANLAPYKG